MFNNSVEKTLNNLKGRLDKNNTLTMRYMGGELLEVKCFFHPPATEEEIVSFFNKLNLIIPNDYKQMLMMHNGTRLLTDVQLYGYEEIYKEYILWNDKENIPDGWFPIGRDTTGYQLYIDSSNYNNSNNNYCLYWMKIKGAETKLDMNFEEWLERFCTTGAFY
jgi:hypothetical protein